MERAELERLSSQELHDLAMTEARRRLDLGFLWSVVKAIPAAQAAAGNLDEAETDVASMTSLLTDVMNAGEPEVADALRPLYLDYLTSSEGAG
jgi:hypothetical protein